MSSQYPSEALGSAIGVLVYSFGGAACCCMILWLVSVHHEKTSYVGLMGISSLFGTIASIVRQCHGVANWRDIRYAQQQHIIENAGRPELITGGAAVGLDLALFYLQAYTYNVSGLLALSWAASLVQSIYAYSDVDRYRSVAKNVTMGTKIFAFAFPAFLMSLLAAEPIKQSTVGYLIIFDFCMLTSVVVTTTLLALILGKYIVTRRQTSMWRIHTRTEPTRTNIYDRWLMLRFTFAFFALSAYEVLAIMFQVANAARTRTPDIIGAEPDLSAQRAIRTSLLYIPGVTDGYLLFIIFGTTRSFRETLYDTFMPKCLRRGEEETTVYWSAGATTFSGRTADQGSVKNLIIPGQMQLDPSMEDIELANSRLEHDVCHLYRQRQLQPGVDKEVDAMADDAPVLKQVSPAHLR